MCRRRRRLPRGTVPRHAPHVPQAAVLLPAPWPTGRRRASAQAAAGTGHVHWARRRIKSRRTVGSTPAAADDFAIRHGGRSGRRQRGRRLRALAVLHLGAAVEPDIFVWRRPAERRAEQLTLRQARRDRRRAAQRVRAFWQLKPAVGAAQQWRALWQPAQAAGHRRPVWPAEWEPAERAAVDGRRSFRAAEQPARRTAAFGWRFRAELRRPIRHPAAVW